MNGFFYLGRYVNGFLILKVKFFHLSPFSMERVRAALVYNSREHYSLVSVNDTLEGFKA